MLTLVKSKCWNSFYYKPCHNKLEVLTLLKWVPMNWQGGGGGGDIMSKPLTVSQYQMIKYTVGAWNWMLSMYLYLVHLLLMSWQVCDTFHLGFNHISKVCKPKFRGWQAADGDGVFADCGHRCGGGGGGGASRWQYSRYDMIFSFYGTL